MSPQPVPAVRAIDRAQWQPEEYDLLSHFVNLDRLANSVVTERGPLQGWFAEALWRHYSYAPFNARVMENYHSLAFFYGYEAPWNIYYRHPEVLRRLELALEYTFRLMGRNGAIPEYAAAELDTPMVAPSSFGMEYMASALEVAGDVMPPELRKRLATHARKAALYVLTSEEAWEHSVSFTNQFLGAMSGGARLARLTGDEELLRHVHQAGGALLGEFMSPMGFLYENDGPETFAYFFVTLHRLVPLYHEWPDDRVREVLYRHCEWMGRWMLPEPDGETVLLSTSHQTRTSGRSYILVPRAEAVDAHAYAVADQRPRIQKGLGALMEGGSRRADPLKLFLMTDEELEGYREAWRRMGPEALDSLREAARQSGCSPVSTLALYPTYAPPAAERDEALASLPCLDPTPRWETMEDDRGNQYAFFRNRRYYTAFAFSTHASAANHGPAFLWLDGAGTLILAHNGGGISWQTTLGDLRGPAGEGTARAPAVASLRQGRGGQELVVRYGDLGFTKAYVVRDEGIDVLLGGAQGAGGRLLVERIPLLLQPEDVIYLDYGTCLAAGMSERGLGVVTRTVAVERNGLRALTIDLGEPVSAALRPTYDATGFVRTELIFAPAPRFFGRTGYRVIAG